MFRYFPPLNSEGKKPFFKLIFWDFPHKFGEDMLEIFGVKLQIPTEFPYTPLNNNNNNNNKVNLFPELS